MATLNKKNFDNPDETMTPEKMKVDNVDLGNGVKAARMTTQPGWKWSECIKPMIGTDTCQKNHVGVCVNGKLMVTHEDGSSIEVGGLSFNFKIKQEITIFRVFFRSILGLVKKNLL